MKIAKLLLRIQLHHNPDGYDDSAGSICAFGLGSYSLRLCELCWKSEALGGKKQCAGQFSDRQNTRRC